MPDILFPALALALMLFLGRVVLAEFCDGCQQSLDWIASHRIRVARHPHWCLD